jgi:hypothetical protein
MTNEFDRAYVLRSAARLGMRFQARSQVAEKLVDWADSSDFDLEYERHHERTGFRGVPPKIWDGLCSALSDEANRKENTLPDQLSLNALILSKHVGLDMTEAEIFEFRCSRSDLI